MTTVTLSRLSGFMHSMAIPTGSIHEHHFGVLTVRKKHVWEKEFRTDMKRMMLVVFVLRVSGALLPLMTTTAGTTQ